MRGLAVFVLAAAAVACGPRPVRPDYPLITEEDDPAAAAAMEREPRPVQPAAAPAPSVLPADDAPPGSISRRALDAVLDAGPAEFLQGVKVNPRLHAGAFTGWEVVSFWPGDPRFAQVDLAPGDVVLRVNGRSIRRPEELQEIWESLRFAPELTVELERGGATRTLKFAIVE